MSSTYLWAPSAASEPPHEVVRTPEGPSEWKGPHSPRWCCSVCEPQSPTATETSAPLHCGWTSSRYGLQNVLSPTYSVVMWFLFNFAHTLTGLRLLFVNVSQLTVSEKMIKPIKQCMPVTVWMLFSVILIRILQIVLKLNSKRAVCKHNWVFWWANRGHILLFKRTNKLLLETFCRVKQRVSKPTSNTNDSLSVLPLNGLIKSVWCETI